MKNIEEFFFSLPADMSRAIPQRKGKIRFPVEREKEREREGCHPQENESVSSESMYSHPKAIEMKFFSQFSNLLPFT